MMNLFEYFESHAVEAVLDAPPEYRKQAEHFRDAIQILASTRSPEDVAAWMAAAIRAQAIIIGAMDRADRKRAIMHYSESLSEYSENFANQVMPQIEAQFEVHRIGLPS